MSEHGNKSSVRESDCEYCMLSTQHFITFVLLCHHNGYFPLLAIVELLEQQNKLYPCKTYETWVYLCHIYKSGSLFIFSFCKAWGNQSTRRKPLQALREDAKGPGEHRDQTPNFIAVKHES